MSAPVLHQVTVGATLGDAVTDHVFQLRRWLREAGFVSEVYAAHVHPALQPEVRPASHYRPGPGERYVIYHHSIGSPVVDHLRAQRAELIVIYHNVTPAEYFTDINPLLAQELRQGRAQLADLRPRTRLALGVSPYNAEELRAAGFAAVDVLPLTLDERCYRPPANPALRLPGGPHLLFVGRLVPHKKQEDLVKLLYFYRRLAPEARLVLVGDPWLPDYERWLRDVIADLKLTEAVTLAGHVGQAELVSCYRLADLYVSMSEHEGVGKPLLESMYLGLPVLAYAAAGVPGTVGTAGVLFSHKHFEALAEVVHWLLSDAALRQRVIARQRAHVQAFLEPAVRQQWTALLAGLGLG